ncbi:MAG: hypothetical protein ABJQ66_05595 [Paracoccaceae bacterium]
MNAQKAVFEVNSDGVKTLAFGAFDCDRYVIFQKDVHEGDDANGQTHIEIDDQIRSAYVAVKQAKFELDQFCVTFDGDENNQLEVQGKSFCIGILDVSEIDAKAAVEAFFADM